MGETMARVAIRDLPWRWVAPANVHLTLKFLGEIPQEDIEELSACAVGACRDLAPFAIRFGQLGGFPSLSRPRVLFFRVEEGARTLELMSARLDDLLAERLQIPRESRPFQAHATVARVKSVISPRIVEILHAVPPLGSTTQAVQTLSLMRSELHPQGAKYHRLKEFALSKTR